jgi:predicted ATPase
MIALIGSHGVGKSTLLRSVKNYLPHVQITDGNSRIVRAYNKEIGNKLSERDEQVLINRLSDNKWPGLVKQEDLFVTRTPFDHFAYSKALGWSDLAEERLRLFEKVGWSNIKFFYIPIEFELEDDGVRYTDKFFQEEIDKLLVSCIRKYDLDVVNLLGSVQERTETVINEYYKYKNS